MTPHRDATMIPQPTLVDTYRATGETTESFRFIFGNLTLKSTKYSDDSTGAVALLRSPVKVDVMAVWPGRDDAFISVEITNRTEDDNTSSINAFLTPEQASALARELRRALDEHARA